MADREPNEHEFLERWRLQLLEASDASGELVAETADWLGISKSAYYRRRRGEMPFSAYEFVILSKRFGLDMNPQGDEVPRFGFDAPLEADSSFDEARYLHQLEASAKLYAAQEGITALVSATDIPIFYLFGEPDLAALKRYLFGLAIDARGARRFNLAQARKEFSPFIGRTAAVARAYQEVEREEAWGPSPLRSLIYQILLLVESAAISLEDTEQLFVAAGRVIDRLERSLVNEEPTGAKLKLWQNRLHSTSSIISFHSPYEDRLYITFDNPNFLTSEDPNAIAYFKAHFEVLRKRSLRIAGHGTLSPARYAQQLRDAVAKAQRKAHFIFADVEDEF